MDVNKFLITIPEADTINHVVLFLTGLQPLNTGLAASIYFSLPNPNAPPMWYYLGYLTNERPSAIYKLSNISSHKQNGADDNIITQSGKAFTFDYAQAPVSHVAQIGISVESLDSVLQMTPATETSASNMSLFVDFMNKTASNLHNYCSSFARNLHELAIVNSSANVTYVPLSTIQNWYLNFSRRLQTDPNFWKTLNS